jgi:hypothetical protein
MNWKGWVKKPSKCNISAALIFELCWCPVSESEKELSEHKSEVLSATVCVFDVVYVLFSCVCVSECKCVWWGELFSGQLWHEEIRTMCVKLFRSHFTVSATTAVESCGIQDNTHRKMSCLTVTCIYRMEQNNSEKLSGMVEGAKFGKVCRETPCFNTVQRQSRVSIRR